MWHCAGEKLKAANKTIEEQKLELSTLRNDLDDANTELESKQTEVTELHGKVVSIRSHALKLEDELRAMNSGKSSNVQRVNELQQEVQIQKKNAGMSELLLLDQIICDNSNIFFSEPRSVQTDYHICVYFWVWPFLICIQGRVCLSTVEGLLPQVEYLIYSL